MMRLLNYEALSSESQPLYLLGTALGLFLLIQLAFFLRPEKVILIPTVGTSESAYGTDKEGRALSLMKEGYSKYRNRPYQLKTRDGHFVILPPKFVDEIKNLPDSHVSAVEASTDFLQPRFTKFGGTDTVAIETINKDLNHNLARVLPEVVDEARYALSVEIPNSTEWTNFQPYKKLLRVVAMMTGRVFVGSELNRNEEWIRTSIDYTTEVIAAAAAIKKWHPMLRPIVKSFVPELRTLYRRHDIAANLVTPLIARRNASNLAPPKESQNLIDWYRQRIGLNKVSDIEHQTMIQLASSFAAIHNTVQTATHALYDLATRQEYQEILREEILQVMSDGDGTLPKHCMPHLQKLDSFIKESQRHNPGGELSFFRMTKKPIELSDGTRIPKDIKLAVQAKSIAFDPNTYNSPEEFDGLRFYNLRQKHGNENKYQFSTASLTSIFFGMGKHACPGRFFASNEIKTVLALLIKDYEIALPKGVTKRPENLHDGITISADPGQCIQIRKRS